jgi:Xaa-Pro aminopeptidase
MTTQDERFEPAVSRLRIPNLSEVNFERLRSGRLERLQTVMSEHEMAVCLLYKPANIRYATGTDMMGVWTAGTFARYCIVPAEGDPILFEYKDAIHIAQRIVKDVRPATYWQFRGPASKDDARRFAAGVVSVLAELGLEGEKLGVDRLDTTGFLALQEADVTLTPASPTADAAREIKTDDEVDLLKINGAIGDAIMAEFEAAIRPGIHEHELLAVLGNSLMNYHGDGLTTRLVSSGQNTNPWMSEAHDKIVMPGDLVGVDTDANGYEGYVIDLSRTFLCGNRATPEQREAYRVAYECVTGMTELVKPGVTFEEFVHAAPRLPEKFRAQRYTGMAHQAGLEIEGPGIPWPEDVEAGRKIPDRVIQENMILCLECYAGEVGAPFGVKLEDQVLVTEDGCELLCTYPFDEKLLA